MSNENNFNERNNEPILTQSEIENLKTVMVDFLTVYAKNNEKLVNEWLPGKIQEALPEYTSEQINIISNELAESIKALDENALNLKEAKKAGMTREAWIKKKVVEATSEMPEEDAKEYLKDLNNTLSECNESMFKIIAKDEGVNESDYQNIKKDFEEKNNQSGNSIKELAQMYAKQTEYSSLQGTAILSQGLDLVEKVCNGEHKEVKEVLKKVWETGKDYALKNVTAAALKVASEKGYLKSIPKESPTTSTASVAWSGIEKMKIFQDLAKNKITPQEAVSANRDVMATTISTVTAKAVSKGIKTVAKFLDPRIKPLVEMAAEPVGNAVGTLVGYIVTTVTTNPEARKKIADGIKKVATVAGKAVCESAKKLISRGVSFVKNLFSKKTTVTQ